MPDATMVDVMKFFGMRPAEFRPQWNALSEQDKKDLKQGIGDESHTY
jgi:hypothetical protein